jgi:acetylornithine aminotransferase/acetylornithine/N-succinyldiaminopimelate aminotransferase
LGKPEKNKIITLKNSFHGRTLTTVTATGQPKYQKYFTPLTPGFAYAERGNFDELLSLASDNTCAIMLEPVQGESGVYPLEEAYLNKIRKLCDDKNILLIFDEIQTGIGRTGKLFAHEHYGVEPDIMTLAKGIAGGFPMGVLMAKENVAKGFEPGDHGTTFGGGPLACAAALATLRCIFHDNLIENAECVGGYLMNLLNKISSDTGMIKEIRGKGLMIGVEFMDDVAAAMKNKLFEAGWLVGNVGQRILRILPPLIATKVDADNFAEALIVVLKKEIVE